jgi:hypothetical protein
MDASGGFLVVWEHLRAGSTGFDIYARRYDATGNPVSGEILVNGYTTGQQRRPDAAGESGEFAVVWQAYDAAGDTDVAGLRLDSDGQPFRRLPRQHVHDVDPEDPRIAMRPSGDFVVTWESCSRPTSSTSTRNARPDPAAQRLGVPGELYTTDFQDYP